MIYLFHGEYGGSNPPGDAIKFKALEYYPTVITPSCRGHVAPPSLKTAVFRNPKSIRTK